MQFLIDTHILLWWLGNSPRLSAEVREMIANPESFVFVSAATVWEMSIKRGLGKLSVPDNLLEMLKVHQFEVLNITAEHGLRVGELPEYHKDPFDRMLIAQAQMEGFMLISGDRKFEQYDVSLLKA
ncbi:type II toxin-antitoxin system VapC family toxin [Picosynechococcus sp. PCC 7117]|uniref:type II toxin-antitoxin system VapC family toxin n=1 Tax=Picosynechococcus sp. PCC 7117 TaxID=195498 RepID=UPI00081049E7|nr:type II toxin-antitoxin system VapC family toxin [Picosynechococcus sp. PCC 7117]ANV88875.1 twitching motility protein PilT [Picosynechococcus sp. PCC 7117]